MLLMNHNFQFCNTRKDFCDLYREIMDNLIGKKILRVWGVWDKQDNEWFVDAPMIIEFENGELTVALSSGIHIAILWNEISHTEKPIWLGEVPEMNWQEDLIWKEYFEIKESNVEKIELVNDENTITGLIFTSDAMNIGILDDGDATIALKDEELLEYLNAEQCRLKNVQDIVLQGEEIAYDFFKTVFNRNIQKGSYPWVEFHYNEQRYVLYSDLERCHLAWQQSYFERSIYDYREFVIEKDDTEIIFSSDSLEELVTVAEINGKKMISMWDELRFCFIADDYKYIFCENERVHIKSIDKYGRVLETPRVVGGIRYYGIEVVVKESGKKSREIVEICENDMEYDERPEIIQELRDAYQCYIDRLTT